MYGEANSIEYLAFKNKLKRKNVSIISKAMPKRKELVILCRYACTRKDIVILYS